MIYLVYVSAAVKPFSQEDLQKLLEKSRLNNSRVEVTGMLLYRDGDFMQALEGPDEAVLTTYQRVAKDPRHAKIIQLLNRETKERSFSNWSMSFRQIDAGQRMEGFSDLLQSSKGFKSFGDQPSLAQKLLLSFRDIGN